jgi:hypothetical protein
LPGPPHRPGPFKAAFNVVEAAAWVLDDPRALTPCCLLQSVLCTHPCQAGRTSGDGPGVATPDTPLAPYRCPCEVPRTRPSCHPTDALVGWSTSLRRGAGNGLGPRPPNCSRSSASGQERARTSVEFPTTNVTPTLLRPFLSSRAITTARETDRRSVKAKLPKSGLLSTLAGHADPRSAHAKENC